MRKTECEDSEQEKLILRTVACEQTVFRKLILKTWEEKTENIL